MDCKRLLEDTTSYKVWINRLQCFTRKCIFKYNRSNFYFYNRSSTKIWYSYYVDRYTENYESTNFDRVDLTTGVFTEYSYTSPSDLTIVAGIRGDYHNTHGFEYLPRLNLKYNTSDQTVVRLSAGKLCE